MRVSLLGRTYFGVLITREVKKNSVYWRFIYDFEISRLSRHNCAFSLDGGDGISKFLIRHPLLFSKTSYSQVLSITLVPLSLKYCRFLSLWLEKPTYLYLNLMSSKSLLVHFWAFGWLIGVLYSTMSPFSSENVIICISRFLTRLDSERLTDLD
jgi:hypothetical protein